MCAFAVCARMCVCAQALAMSSPVVLCLRPVVPGLCPIHTPSRLLSPSVRVHAPTIPLPYHECAPSLLHSCTPAPCNSTLLRPLRRAAARRPRPLSQHVTPATPRLRHAATCPSCPRFSTSCPCLSRSGSWCSCGVSPSSCWTKCSSCLPACSSASRTSSLRWTELASVRPVHFQRQASRLTRYLWTGSSA